jgi:hypothetical protein
MLRSIASLAAAVACLQVPAGAILIRHDKVDADYRKLGERYPAVGSFGRAGTGALIGDRWVLSAAHVVAGMRQGATFDLADRRHTIEARIIHPEWKEMGAADIALVRLRDAVEGIAPLRIYEQADESGRSIVFVGFGGTGTGESGPQRPEDGLKRGATNVVDRADRDWLFFDFDAPGPDATDLEGISGPGDSGGPAILDKDGQSYVVGVSVFGKPGARGRGTYGAEEGYTRVSTHARWIMEQIGGHPTRSGLLRDAAGGDDGFEVLLLAGDEVDVALRIDPGLFGAVFFHRGALALQAEEAAVSRQEEVRLQGF